MIGSKYSVGVTAEQELTQPGQAHLAIVGETRTCAECRHWLSSSPRAREARLRQGARDDGRRADAQGAAQRHRLQILRGAGGQAMSDFDDEDLSFPANMKPVPRATPTLVSERDCADGPVERRRKPTNCGRW